LDAGATGTFTGNTTVPFSSLAPFGASNNGGTYGISLAPVSYAGTEFLFYNQRTTLGAFSYVSPWGNANVTLYNSPGAGWTKSDSIIIPTGTQATMTSLAAGQYLIVANSSILVTWGTSAESEDYMVLPPAAQELWGVASDEVYGVCMNDSTTITYYTSANTTATAACNAGDGFSLTNQGSAGTAPATYYTANNPIAVHAQADGDGTEGTPFIAATQLGTTFFVPNSYEYLAIAAPTNATNCTRYSAAGAKIDSFLTDSAEDMNPYPSKALFGSGSAGDSVVCDAEVFAYYELGTSYETLLLNEHDNRQYHDPAPLITPGTEQQRFTPLPASGTPFTTPASLQGCGFLGVNDTCAPSWSVNATGATGLWKIAVLFVSNHSAVQSNHTSSRTVNITDITPPIIALDGAPLNNSGTTGNLTVFFNVSDTSNIRNCTFLINGTQRDYLLAPAKDTRLNFSIAGLGLGEHFWSINCTDDTYNKNTNTTGNYTVTGIAASTYGGLTTDFSTVLIENITNLIIDSPGIGMINYTNWTNLSGGVSLDDLTTIANTSITVNSTTEPRLNRSALLYFRGLDYQFAPVLLRNNKYCGPPTCTRLSYTGGVARFNVTHFTNYQSAKNANFTIYDDTDPEGGGTPRAPTELVMFYGNYSNWSTGEPVHGPNVNCTIRFNISDAWTPDANFTYNSATKLYEYSRTFDVNGTYEWNAFCNGTSEGYEELNVSDNVTISQDFLALNVSVNQSSIVEGDTLIIRVNVSNKGSPMGTNVTLNITVWNGSDWTDDSFYRAEVNFTGNQDHLENFTWTATIGTHHFNATIDPDHLASEANETNNNFTINYTVSAWEILYGMANQSIFIGDASNALFHSWNATSSLGNLFFSDDDSSFDPGNLVAFTQPDDFNESDTALGLTGFNDSIRRLFDANDDGVADTTATFTIMGSPVTGVPVVNSTNTSAFITGILWDSADGGAYTGAEDLVFVTKFNASQKGKYGTYDYEVRLPATLGDLFGSSPSVTQLQEIR
ncbi:hypothetical protein D6789_02630, partial [Candidatus Woesearchaeota archaeon]